MDNVDRMYRHLVRTIRTKFPHYLVQPFDVAELHQTILPYRLHRRELGLETNDDYEITLSELLTGERGYLIVDDRMRDTLKRELATPNPDPGVFKQFIGTTVALSPSALRSLEAGPDDPTTPLRPVAVPAPGMSSTPPERSAPAAPSAPPAVASRPASPSAPPAAPAPPPASPAPLSPVAGAPPTTPGSSRSAPPQRTSKPTISPSGARAIIPEPGERCTSCNETLPPGRPITFCPHCGQNLTTINCPACGSELELGWKFCPICGRPANAG
jgi:hypothetical protein